jgi:hypothetical protein
MYYRLLYFHGGAGSKREILESSLAGEYIINLESENKRINKDDASF